MTNIIMDVHEVIRILQQHNKWRRGDDSSDMEDPKRLGEAIDVAISELLKIKK